jgi:hypothetical protein
MIAATLTIATLIAKLILLRPTPRMTDGVKGLVSARTLTTPLARARIERRFPSRYGRESQKYGAHLDSINRDANRGGKLPFICNSIVTVGGCGVAQPRRDRHTIEI